MKCTETYIYANDYKAREEIGRNISFALDEAMKDFSEICVLCIGSDRATGDSLGPIVGQMLQSALSLSPIKIYGNLRTPAHAVNLQSTLEKIYTENQNPFIIAVDAALSKSPSHIGRLNTGIGSLKPGSSVGKSLPNVGHFYITGVVNWMPSIESLTILQSTRLGNVFEMAEVIAGGITYAIESYTMY
ncbi:MAG: spore protease YyaC [Defluviitaleaceae bacterium]|nr:spore protease YyaC [Defluviitaleaceae bacterium]